MFTIEKSRAPTRRPTTTAIPSGAAGALSSSKSNEFYTSWSISYQVVLPVGGFIILATIALIIAKSRQYKRKQKELETAYRAQETGQEEVTEYHHADEPMSLSQSSSSEFDKDRSRKSSRRKIDRPKFDYSK